MRNKNNITCGCKKWISAILIQSDINKWRLSQLDKLDKLYNNYEETRILQISKIDFIYENNQLFPNNSDIHLKACDSTSSYYCTSPLTG